MCCFDSNAANLKLCYSGNSARKKNGSALRLNCLWWGKKGFSSSHEMETFFVWTCFNPDRETIKCRMKNPRQRSDTLFQGLSSGTRTRTQADSHTNTKRCVSYKLLSKPSAKLFWANLKVALSHINHVIACTVLWRNVSLKPWKAKISR